MVFTVCLICSAIVLPIFGGLFVGFAFCAGLVSGYFHIGAEYRYYFLWAALLLACLVTFVLYRWNSRRHFLERITSPVIAFFKKRDDHAA